jgi:hypothetical protein
MTGTVGDIRAVKTSVLISENQVKAEMFPALLTTVFANIIRSWFVNGHIS